MWMSGSSGDSFKTGPESVTKKLVIFGHGKVEIMDKKRVGIIGGGISGTALGYYLSLYDAAAIVVRQIK